MAVIVSLIISLLMGKTLIAYLHRKRVGETIRDLGLEGQKEKQGTPTMGGLIILAAILIPTLLFAKLNNIYIILMIITTVWMGTIGFIDDYIKVFRKNKEGLAGRFKIVGQVGLGLIVGYTMFFHPSIVVKEKIPAADAGLSQYQSFEESNINSKFHLSKAEKSTKPNVPFYKNNEFDYAKLLKFIGDDYEKYAFWIFIPIVIIIITAVSNGANITDGIDGLATGTSAIIGATLGV